MTRRMFFFILTTLLVLPLLAACAGGSKESERAYKMAPLDQMPDDVKKSSATVIEAYQFAVANPDVLKEIPCYCGCGAMGHKSNYACYVQSDEGGKITFDTHALGCSICVDITRDTMRMLEEGKSVAEIKTAVDATYSQYGPSNIEE